jgi:DNA-binding NtrC family response regulator
MSSDKTPFARAPRIVTILVVDDTETVRKSTARCLRRNGFVVLEAGTANEALKLIEANGRQLDLVLCDLVLPSMSGVELINEVRRRFPEIGTALMTGHVGSSARYEETPDLGAHVLLKPFTPGALLQRVTEALEHTGPGEPEDTLLS